MKRLVIFLNFLILTSCGTHDASESSDSHDHDADAVADSHDQDYRIPPEEYYDALFARELQLMDDEASVAAAPQLYVDFDGATIRKGYGPGESFIVCRRQARIPASGLSASAQQDVIERVQDFYSRAGTNLRVTSERPSSGRYTTIIVGGSYRDLGCSGGRNVLGVAPLDRGNRNPEDIGFAFNANVQSLKIIAETVAHEAGHSYGLDHIQQKRGLMYPSITSAIEGFVRGTVRGRARIQDAPKILQADVGKGSSGGNTPAPDDEEEEPEVDDEPQEDEGDDEEPIEPDQPTPTPTPTPTPAPGPGIPNFPNLPGLGNIGDLGDLIGGIFPGGGNGGGIGGGLDLGDIFGNIGGRLPDFGSGGLGFPGLDDLLSGLGGSPFASTPGAKLPKFDEMFGIAGISSSSELIPLLRSHKAYVHANYSGRERDAMLSALKVGYLQAYSGK